MYQKQTNCKYQSILTSRWPVSGQRKQHRIGKKKKTRRYAISKNKAYTTTLISLRTLQLSPNRPRRSKILSLTEPNSISVAWARVGQNGGTEEKRQIHRGNVKRGGSVANWLTDWFAEMKANTEPGNTMGGVRIAYQVDSRHSRVKWIGPYEAGWRVRKGKLRRSKRRSLISLVIQLWQFAGREAGTFHAPAHFVLAAEAVSR